MSWWLWPTTADVGIRAFSAAPSSLVDEVILGMQNIVLSDKYHVNLEDFVIGEIEWSHPLDRSLDRLMVRILEEVLYVSEVQNRWVVKSKTMLKQDHVSIIFTYVSADEIVRDVEIKAVTRHSLEFRELMEGDSIPSIDGLPEMVGPGWYSSIIFDL